MNKLALKIFLFFLVSISFDCFSQTDHKSTDIETPVPTLSESLPEFPGGNEAIRKIVSENFVYPPSAIRDDISGKVLVSFLVDTLGNVADLKIRRGIREDVNNEALRLIQLLNGWIPARQNGKNVAVTYAFPVYFILD